MLTQFKPSIFFNASTLCTHLMRIVFSVFVMLLSFHAQANTDWDNTLKQAKGQTVYWSAWGGAPNINEYIKWVGQQVENQYGVKLVHVKTKDTADTVARVLAEKSSGNTNKGSVDLIWINGENFASMKKHGLLTANWVQSLPNFKLTDPDNHPELHEDFTVPVEGMESPYGRAQIVFYYDSKFAKNLPQNTQELLAWAKNNQGRFTYPLVPDFTGSTFLKQVLIESSHADDALYKPVTDETFAKLSQPVWAYLDQLHPNLWRKGKHFPASSTEMKKLLGDGEITLAFTFNPSEPAVAVKNFELPDTIRSYVFKNGTIGNTHFVAIPFNASHVAGAKVVSNFLLSPQAQAHKSSLDVWGDATVLSMKTLSKKQQALFTTNTHPALPPANQIGNTLREPHPSWMETLEKEWGKRYGAK